MTPATVVPVTGGEIFGIRIGLDPNRPGLERISLLDFDRPVWTVVAFLQGVDGDEEETAASLVLPVEAVRAAAAYYAAHPRHIDVMLAAFDSCCIE